jgi:hypothetical protein
LASWQELPVQEQDQNKETPVFITEREGKWTSILKNASDTWKKRGYNCEYKSEANKDAIEKEVKAKLEKILKEKSNKDEQKGTNHEKESLWKQPGTYLIAGVVGITLVGILVIYKFTLPKKRRVK